MKPLSLRETLRTLVSDLRQANPDIPQQIFEKITRSVGTRVAGEPAPRIALIGETGVGKSSTLNALFRAGREVSHQHAQTQEAAAISIPGDRGPLVVYDMPGLDESEATEAAHRAIYQTVLQDVDVALWVLDAQFRAIRSVQTYVRDVLPQVNPKLVNKMVFALNKVDLVHPGESAWIPITNLPSEEQEVNIKARCYDVQQKISEVLPDWRGTVIGYSTVKRYNLPQLFAAMLSAVPKERQWVVASRESLADFFELVDPKLLRSDNRLTNRTVERVPDQDAIAQAFQLESESPSRVEADRSTLVGFDAQDKLARSLQAMSENDFAALAATEEFIAFMRQVQRREGDDK